MKTALSISYDGTAYCGWQAQSQGVGVQAVLEPLLADVADHPVQLICSGRTDAGVHATRQIAHFEHCAPRADQAWLRGVNDRLPPDIRIEWAGEVSADFHARFSAQSRCYQYVLLNQSGPNALEHRYTAWDFHPLQLEPMQKAAALLLGKHDFSAFRSAHCQSHCTERDLLRFDVQQCDNRYTFTLEASGFLHNMVRILVGSLLVVGRGEQPASWMQRILQQGDRTLAGMTLPASGLFFCGARYADIYRIPQPLYRY